jgi:hypothetical protein
MPTCIIRAIHDPGCDERRRDFMSAVVAWVSAIPPGLWVAAIVTNVALTALTWSIARRRVRRAGQRDSDSAALPSTAKDTALTMASLIPAGLFWLMVLGGSLHGLVAFGHDVLGWRGGWEYLVPGTLDGVSVTFAMLAFRAIKRGKAPDRCYRVVWGAALASATINFANEYSKSGNALAGGYVALLSLFGMFMFDEFLNQFEDGSGTVRRENPKFGIRWLTWPSNTFLAAIAWRNHPPPEGTAGTVANAVANLDRVRAAKRATRQPPVQRAPQKVPVSSEGPVQTLAAPPAAPAAAAAGARPRRERPKRPGGSLDEVKVPATRAAVARWVDTWQAMCRDSALTRSAMQRDDLAREHFQLSARQLRNIRAAATSGALSRQAGELGVDHPAGLDLSGVE